MASLVSSFLHHSANKIDDFSSRSSNKNKKRQPYGQLHQATLSTPIFPTTAGFYQQQHPQASQSTEWLATPPPYDPTSSQLMTPPSPPIMTPSSSWTTNKSVFGATEDPAVIMDRRSISQGMKLVSIAADEYDEGNEEVALDIYLTGLDKILMALPNKTDTKTKLALREKLLSVEERVGILTLAHHHRTDMPPVEDNNNNNEAPQPTGSLVDTLILNKITTTWQAMTNAAVAAAVPPPSPPPPPAASTSAYRHPYQTVTSTEPSSSICMDRFKQLSHAVIQASVTFAILIKQSPVPALMGFCFQYVMMLLLWVDAQYGVRQRAHAVALTGLKSLLDTNEQYRLHEFITELVFMLVTACLKAVVAYRETPRYHHVHEVEVDTPVAVIEEVAPPTAAASSSSTWLWSSRR
ncbi:unnamed protein product [Absidia cylindrospora]